MSEPAEPSTSDTPRLRDIALAAIAGTSLRGNESLSAPEDAVLQKTFDLVGSGGRSLAETFEHALQHPAEVDAHLVAIAKEIQLGQMEILAIALAASVEDDPLVGRVLAHVQAPVGGSRPTLGLICHAFDSVFGTAKPALPLLLGGTAVQTGVLTILNESAPLPERPIAVPTVLCLALAGHDGSWPGATVGSSATEAVPLPASVLADAERHATALGAHPNRALVLRTGSPAEGRAVAALIAANLQRRPLFINTDKLAGLGPWLRLRGLLPAYCLELAPGERRTVPAIAGYTGPVVFVSGPDGAVETAHGAAASWILEVPPEAERLALWMNVLREQSVARRLARDFRHGAGRIAHLGRLADHQAAIAQHKEVGRDDILAAAWTGEGSGLESLAEPLRARVKDTALILTPVLRADLDTLLMRCRGRDRLVEGLGDSAKTRYRPGVRALFTGPSGTGKTLAAGWLATHLGLPLYRVDLASVTSKFIGETEKNLSQLLARAEQAEVILLFDEADSLFGKRTDISDSNDRFANAQTNYLLQRIENYDGIVLLTSNSQARFDTAFARRLDFVVEFPAPGPDERRELWLSHLGSQSTLEQDKLNQLAALVDVSGGHIRNAVLTAAVLARHEQRKIEFNDVVTGVEAELRKLGRHVSVSLKTNPRPEA
ncbi:MAG: ATP-binding protein [Opitutaceae bacterium]